MAIITSLLVLYLQVYKKHRHIFPVQIVMLSKRNNWHLNQCLYVGNGSTLCTGSFLLLYKGLGTSEPQIPPRKARGWITHSLNLLSSHLRDLWVLSMSKSTSPSNQLISRGNDSFRIVTLCCARCFTQLTIQRQVLTSQFTEDKAEASVVEEPLAKGHTVKGVVEAGLNQRLWFKFSIFLFYQVPLNGSIANLYFRFPFFQKCLTTFRESFGFSIYTFHRNIVASFPNLLAKHVIHHFWYEETKIPLD